jgi:hypothetical protein
MVITSIIRNNHHFSTLSLAGYQMLQKAKKACRAKLVSILDAETPSNAHAAPNTVTLLQVEVCKTTGCTYSGGSHVMHREPMLLKMTFTLKPEIRIVFLDEAN